MTEALQLRLRSSSAYFEIYVRGAQFDAILRDTSTISTERLVLVPEQLFEQLAERLISSGRQSEAARYLAQRGSEGFLRYFDKNLSTALERLLSTSASPGQPDNAMLLGCRLVRLGLMTTERRAILWSSVVEEFECSGSYGFLEIEGVIATVGEGALKALLIQERDSGFAGLERLRAWLSDDVTEIEEAELKLEVLGRYYPATAAVFEALGLLDEDGFEELRSQVEFSAQDIKSNLARLKDSEEQRADHDYDSYEESMHEARYELEHGLFSDVDE